MPILPTNWRPLVVTSLLIAQKMSDDRFLSNADFAEMYPFFDVKELNILEMKFLELIQYNTHVKFGIYTKYYLELKSLVPEKFLLKPIDKFSMTKLENQSLDKEKKLKVWSQTMANEKKEGQYSQNVIS
jgi:hypothetical protein